MQKPRSISLLSPELRNQIAAGEVVERPASVLKELVENALDAGADQISIELEDGGQGLIRVQDNGHGIAKSELELAVTRHATSKIYNLDDLLSIYSYGFRGEALPSIASVSRFSITSIQASSHDIASSLQVEFGEVKQSTPASLPRGTLIEVRDLFANIPARLKFLKSPATENKKAQEWLTRLAIAKPEVGFSLKFGGREALNLAPRQNLFERLNEIWPPLIMESMRPFDNIHHGIRTHGLASLPQTSQIRADRMLFYVNGRAIHDKTLSAAVREAYKGRLTTKDYPQLVIFIEIDPEEIDINVHPAKTEIRFRDSSSVFSAVRRGLQAMLEKNDSSYDFLNAESTLQSPPINQASLTSDFESQTAINQRSAEHSVQIDSRPQGFWGSIDAETIIPKKQFEPEQDLQTEVYTTNSNLGLHENSATYSTCLHSNTTYESYDNYKHVPTEYNADNAQEHISANVQATIGNLQYLGQVDDTYLLLKSSNDTLILLDQHAVHERILFAKMQNNAQANSGQILALPLEFNLHSSELERVLELKKSLERLAFELELTEQTLYIRAIPAMLERSDAQKFLQEVLAGRKDDLDTLFISFACKAAIKARQKLTIDEIMELVKQWLNTPDRDFCPHGRPCVLRFTAHDLEKMFKRK